MRFSFPPLLHFRAPEVTGAQQVAGGLRYWETVADSKPRILQGNRDMIWSMLALMAGCLVFAAIGGFVSCSPGGKPQTGPIPEFDAAHAYAQDARTMPYPVREPQLPEGWQSNSGRTQDAAGNPVSIVGYVTPDGGYVELLQTNAVALDLRGFGQGPRPHEQALPLAGHEWTVFTGDEDIRPMWVLDLGEVRLGVSGQSTQAEFETMARAASEAEPLPRS